VFTYGLTGMRWRADRLHLDPLLPPQLSDGVTLRGLHWRGRTFDVRIGASTTTVTLRGGSAAQVETPAGTRTLSSSLSIPTRRPDLVPTTNAARCKPATASSEEPGMYAEAAVDGSDATFWAPTAASASLTSDLGARTRVTGVAVEWTDQRPTSSRIETSLDGTTWTPMRNATYARYVRVSLTRDTAAPDTGIRELVVTSR
jgi:hypothetical protein